MAVDPVAISRTYGFEIIARRWLATWIDFVVLALILLIPDFVLGNELYQKTILLWLGLAVVYISGARNDVWQVVGKAGFRQHRRQ
jgi:hypothetical protein